MFKFFQRESDTDSSYSLDFLFKKDSLQANPNHRRDLFVKFDDTQVPEYSGKLMCIKIHVKKMCVHLLECFFP
jgi:hypothetical protein